MILDEKLRWAGFWILDGLRGGQTRKYYDRIRYAWKEGSSVAETEERIRNLIRHAVKTTDFYKDYPEDTPLEKLPVVNKDTFRQHYDSFLSSTYKDAEDNRVMCTSGSTGTPLRMIQNKDKICHNTAGGIFLGAAAGYYIGMKEAFIRVWVNNVRKSKLRLFQENLIMMDSSRMDEQALERKLEQISVYARVSPEHKIRIVRAWQQRGNLVAMTGDGVNDAPALKQADIGVAMGITGTEVAKDAAGMVLADDNFATIVKAVKNGRNVYANIKRAVQFLLSGNTAGILTVLYASLMGLPVPFSAVHLLFINLLTDSLPAIALGLEPHTDEVMREKPCPRNEDILTKPFLLSVSMEGPVIAAATITAFYLGLSYGGAAAGQTMAFSTLCLSRLFHSFSCKSQHPVLLTRKFWNNRALLGAFAAGSLLLGLVLLVPALEPLFSVAPLSVGMISAVVGLAFCSMLTIQLLKRFRR